MKEVNSENEIVNLNLDKNKNYFTEGYWQSYRSLLGFEEIIKQDLLFDFLIPDEIKKETEAIENSESVSIHFRRKEYSHLVDLSYYCQAISMIRNKIVDPKFYIFTDDVFWVKNNFLQNQNDIFLIDSHSHIFDFYLMSKCKHHIISNSTFAWWASWLSNSKNKIILAPPSEKWPNINIIYSGLTIL